MTRACMHGACTAAGMQACRARVQPPTTNVTAEDDSALGSRMPYSYRTLRCRPYQWPQHTVGLQGNARLWRQFGAQRRPVLNSFLLLPLAATYPAAFVPAALRPAARPGPPPFPVQHLLPCPLLLPLLLPREAPPAVQVRGARQHHRQQGAAHAHGGSRQPGAAAVAIPSSAVAAAAAAAAAATADVTLQLEGEQGNGQHQGGREDGLEPGGQLWGTREAGVGEG